MIHVVDSRLGGYRHVVELVVVELPVRCRSEFIFEVLSEFAEHIGRRLCTH